FPHFPGVGSAQPFQGLHVLMFRPGKERLQRASVISEIVRIEEMECGLAPVAVDSLSVVRLSARVAGALHQLGNSKIIQRPVAPLGDEPFYELGEVAIAEAPNLEAAKVVTAEGICLPAGRTLRQARISGFATRAALSDLLRANPTGSDEQQGQADGDDVVFHVAPVPLRGCVAVRVRATAGANRGPGRRASR